MIAQLVERWTVAECTICTRYPSVTGSIPVSENFYTEESMKIAQQAADIFSLIQMKVISHKQTTYSIVLYDVKV